MIHVSIQRNKNYIQSIEIKGHALFDQHGKDIVCAGVSSIIIGGLNMIDHMHMINLCEYEIEEGYVKVVILDCLNHDLQVVLETLYVQLKTIEESYTSYISIQEV